MKLTIYHNKNCSKSRKALEILKSKNADCSIIDYIKNPLTADEIQNILNLLHINPIELLRKNDSLFKSLNLDSFNGTDKDFCKIISKHPKLIERPIIIRGNKAVIGRPPEKVLELL